LPNIRCLSHALAAVFVLSIFTTSASAQTLTPDEKELSTYRLTMPTLKKVMAVVEGYVEEMSKDPKFQEMEKVKAQIKALEDKDELTDAQEKELEKLRERLESLEEEVERATEASGIQNPETLDQMEASMKKQPVAMKLLAREGLTPREYAKTMMALLQASLAEGFSQGKADLSKLPPGINPENVKFVRDNKEVLAQMQAALAKQRK
jgi:hypothetical protein